MDRRNQSNHVWSDGDSSKFRCEKRFTDWGEPLLQAGSTELLNLLVDDGNLVLVETNGSIDISVLPHGVIAILDIKSPGSHQRHMMDPTISKG